MASITSTSASPTTVAPKGGTSKIVPVISNPSATSTITLTLDGASTPLQITVQEPIAFSVDPNDEGKPGTVVATVDAGGTLQVGSDGQSFVFIAS